MRRPSLLLPAFLAFALLAPPAGAQQLQAALPDSIPLGATVRVPLEAIDAIGRPAPGARVILSCNETSIVWPSLDRLTGRAVGRTVCRAAWDRVDGARQEVVDTIRVVATVATEPEPQPDPEPEPEPEVPPPTGAFVGAAELPRVHVVLPTEAQLTGATHLARTASELHGALQVARCGDRIVVQPGTYVGSFTLGPRDSGCVIQVRAAGPIPKGRGERVVRADSLWMPFLESPGLNQSTLKTAPGAEGWWLVGLHIRQQAGAVVGSLVTIAGHEAGSVARVPRRITLDRLLVRSRPELGVRRCVTLNGAYLAVVDSWLDECHARDADSQAILAWTGPGPLLIRNNTLIGAGENVMMGGSDPEYAGVLPRDVEILRNHFTKPTAWRMKNDADSLVNPAGWMAKNLLELKVGQRMLVEGNVFEHSWKDGQQGFALLFKSVNQSGRAPWSETSDVVVRCNVIRDVAGGVSLAGKPESHPAVPASRMTFVDNIFERVDPRHWINGRLFQVELIPDLTITRTTAVGGGHSALYILKPMERLTVTENVFDRRYFGAVFTSAGSGTKGLDNLAPGWTFTGNLVAGVSAASYPSANTYVGALPSPLPTGVGADAAKVAACTAGVVVQ